MSILNGKRGGSTYDPELDEVRLNKQAQDVWRAMRDGCWRSLKTISLITGHPEASISARLRDYRKDRFGSHFVDRERIEDSGLFRYRLVPNPKVKVKLSREV